MSADTELIYGELPNIQRVCVIRDPATRDEVIVVDRRKFVSARDERNAVAVALCKARGKAG